MNQIKALLFRPVDNSPLIIFRMIFGLLIFLEAWGAVATGWVTRAFVEPTYNFPFINFSWLQPLPGEGMYYYYIVMGIAGLMVMVGYRYRLGISIYTIMWAGVYFMQKTSYNNHYYLLVLLCVFMCLVPANAYASNDVKKGRLAQSLTCPQWCIWIFVIQITIVYLYASVAKMYPDWLAGKPIAIWFNGKADYPIIGDVLQLDWFQTLVVYGGIGFDLLIAPALIWKKTRKSAFFISIFFHIFNSIVFQVGIFPYMGIAWAVFFFEPEKIRKLFFKKKPALQTIAEQNLTQVKGKPSNNFKKQIILVGLSIYFLIQIALPLRHHFIPGNVFWTEEGHRLSWRMMLRVKWGTVYFRVVDNKTKKEQLIAPTTYLSGKQARSIATRPDMCWQFIQILKEDFKQKGMIDISIYAKSSVSLNGRQSQPLYKDSIDLANIEWKTFEHAAWLTRLDE